MSLTTDGAADGPGDPDAENGGQEPAATRTSTRGHRCVIMCFRFQTSGSFPQLFLLTSGLTPQVPGLVVLYAQRKTLLPQAQLIHTIFYRHRVEEVTLRNSTNAFRLRYLKTAFHSHKHLIRLGEIHLLRFPLVCFRSLHELRATVVDAF